ncbi:hypothetical protein ACQ4PT_018887 [Festuca glaucescens]
MSSGGESSAGSWDSMEDGREDADISEGELDRKIETYRRKIYNGKKRRSSSENKHNDIKKKWKTAMVQSDDTTYEDGGEKHKTKFDKGVHGKSKPRGRSGSNFTVRCSLSELFNLIDNDLNELQKNELKRLGWGFILDYKLSSCISRPLLIKLYKKLDVETLRMEFAGGREICVTAHVVHAVFDLPNGDIRAPCPSLDGNTSDLRWIKNELGLEESETASVRHLINHIKKGAMDEFTIRCIFLVICMQLICPTQNNRLSREVGVVRNNNIAESENMDFCQLVVDEIKRAVPTLADVKGRPRVKYLDKKVMLSVLRADVIDKDRWGRLNWKSKEERSYYLEPANKKCAFHTEEPYADGHTGETLTKTQRLNICMNQYVDTLLEDEPGGDGISEHARDGDVYDEMMKKHIETRRKKLSAMADCFRASNECAVDVLNCLDRHGSDIRNIASGSSTGLAERTPVGSQPAEPEAHNSTIVHADMHTSAAGYSNGGVNNDPIGENRTAYQDNSGINVASIEVETTTDVDVDDVPANDNNTAIVMLGDAISRTEADTNVSDVEMSDGSKEDDVIQYDAASKIKELRMLIGKTDLSKARLVFMHVTFDGHITAYILNTYPKGGRVEVIDTRDYRTTPKGLSRSSYHNRFGESMLKRFNLLLAEMYPKNTMPSWGNIAPRAKYFKVHKGDQHAIGFRYLKCIENYDGKELVNDLKDVDSRAIMDEYLFWALFCPANKAKEELPTELKSYAPKPK